LEKTPVEPHETTVANADIWAQYFHDEWSRWLTPFGAKPAPVSQVAHGTAARVASFLTLVAAGPIAWLYNTNPNPTITEIHPPRPARTDDEAAA
jgi:hypothetical protein